jgi:hypothetical protein
VNGKRAYLVFAGLYLLSFAVLAAWFVVLIIGVFNPSLMAFANKVALPTLLSSVAGLTIFKWLATRAERGMTA